MIQQSKSLPNLWVVRLNELRLGFQLVAHNPQFQLFMEQADPINLIQQTAKSKIMSLTVLFIYPVTEQVLVLGSGLKLKEYGKLYMAILVILPSDQ